MDGSPIEREALDAWVLASLPRAVAYALSLVKDLATADDLVQQCYCRLLEKANVYNLPRDGTRLLFKAITNAAVDHYRRTRGAARLESVNSTEHKDHSHRGSLPRDPRAREPIEIMMQDELEQTLAVVLDQLPLPQRAALELKSLGHSLQDIGESLGISANHAGVLIHRARQTVAASLKLAHGEVDR